MLRNGPGRPAAWITGVQALKPGAHMPAANDIDAATLDRALRLPDQPAMSEDQRPNCRTGCRARPASSSDSKRRGGCRRGWRQLKAVNNTYIGKLYIATALLFLLLAGVLGLLMRAQLALPGNALLSASTYNQVFTMHGTVMMFLFAVPVVEALAVYLLPNMLGARDLPFPRLSAYAYWAYAIGGLAFFCTLFVGLAPDGGWFMYPPLTSRVHSPGLNADFWLLGIGFIEISAIAGAIELIVGILMTRAPGMTLARMPVFAWAMLVVGAMIVFAFPAIIAGTALLEMERAFDWPFFVAERGGDPLLWQHLFWFFGHPEVYIIFLPAAGWVSTMLPAMVGKPLAGHNAIVAALIATGVISFALWAHHMFTAGLGTARHELVSAASLAVAIPAAMQVFSWIATLWRGDVRWTTPTLFILGFLLTFVIGGLTGVMVAVLPFDAQVHDSYFVVAHLHYVLIGGVVMPLFAAIYYWLPLLDGHRLSERLGRWVVGLVVGGFHVAFFPMHIAGMLGMPRRVYTYDAGLGWEWPNAVSSLGAAMLGTGVALLLFDVVRTLASSSAAARRSMARADARVAAGRTTTARAAFPQVRSSDPLWQQPGARRRGRAGPALAAGHGHRPARDDRHQRGRRAPAPPDRPARRQLAADRRRRRHGRLLPAPHRQVGRHCVRVRRARHRRDAGLAVADRPQQRRAHGAGRRTTSGSRSARAAPRRTRGGRW